MAQYVVFRKEIWLQGVLVEAESEDSARTLVDEGEGDDLPDTLEYSDTPDEDGHSVVELYDVNLHGIADNEPNIDA